MIKNPITKLTLNYLLIITVLCVVVSTFIYIDLVKNTTELFKTEQTKIEKKFGTEDPRYSKRVLFVEDGIKNIQNKAIVNLLGLNIIIISIVGLLAYFFAKRTIKPIEESVRKQKEFISNVSHELKTPLTALKSTFEIDLKNSKSDLKETIKSGIEEVDKINMLINGFLKLSELDSKYHQLKLEKVNIKECLDEIIDKNKTQIHEKELGIETNFTHLKFFTDKFLFSELMSIIIENAIKFNKLKGIILIRTFKENGFDFISIKDEGKGIKEENINKIFERFYKEDSSRSKNDGFGIGLALAKEISSILKCEIIVKSNPTQGTEFKLKFSALFQN